MGHDNSPCGPRQMGAGSQLGTVSEERPPRRATFVVDLADGALAAFTLNTGLNFALLSNLADQ